MDLAIPTSIQTPAVGEFRIFCKYRSTTISKQMRIIFFQTPPLFIVSCPESSPGGRQQPCPVFDGYLRVVPYSRVSWFPCPCSVFESTTEMLATGVVLKFLPSGRCGLWNRGYRELWYLSWLCWWTALVCLLHDIAKTYLQSDRGILGAPLPLFEMRCLSHIQRIGPTAQLKALYGASETLTIPSSKL